MSRSVAGGSVKGRVLVFTAVVVALVGLALLVTIQQGSSHEAPPRRPAHAQSLSANGALPAGAEPAPALPEFPTALAAPVGFGAILGTWLLLRRRRVRRSSST